MDASTATAKRPPPRQIALRTRFVCARRPHTFTTHVPAPSPGDGSRIFVGLASRLVQMIGTNRKLGDPELTKYRQLARWDQLWTIEGRGLTPNPRQRPSPTEVHPSCLVGNVDSGHRLRAGVAALARTSLFVEAVCSDGLSIRSGRRAARAARR